MKSILKSIMLLGVILLVMHTSCKKDDAEEDNNQNNASMGDPCPGIPSFIYGGQTYNTVLIGTQCWMKENLNIGTRINGDQEQTNNQTIEKYCYNDEENNCDEYGGLYQWDEMMQYTSLEAIQGICPDGWHLPSDEEWKILEGNADTQFGVGHSEWDSIYLRGFDAATRLKSTSGWGSEFNGTDIFGFSALPTGLRQINGDFDILGEAAFFWSSTAFWSRTIICYFSNINRESGLKGYGKSVRCIRD